MGLKTRLRTKTTIPLIMIVSFSGGHIAAQTAGATSLSKDNASDHPEITVGDIIVTAQRREQSITDVPISMAVVSADTLASRGVKDLAGVASLVSNTQIFDGGLGQPTWVIRGVGLLDFSPNNTPASAIYIDDIYQTSNAFGTVSLFDIDRVEILKGPQGGLYGRNTSGGAVRVEIKKPSLQSAEGSLSVGAERWQRFRGDAAISIPLVADRLAIRLSGLGEASGSGWQTALSTDEEWGQRKRWSLRGQILARFSDSGTARLVVDGGRDRSEITLGSAVGTRSLSGDAPGFLCPALLAGKRDDRNCIPYGSLVNALYLGNTQTNLTSLQSSDGRRTLSDPISNLNNKSLGISGYLTFDLGSIELTSTSSFRRFDYRIQADNDATTGEFGHQDSISKFNVFSQDVRIASTGNGPLSWMVGGVYARDTIKEDRTFLFRDNLPVIASYALTDSSQGIANLAYDQKTRSLSAFGQLEYKVSDAWAVDGAIRYSDETKSYRNGALTFPVTGVALQSGLADDYALKSHWTGKLSLQYQPDKLSLLYASISRGYKSGGFFGGFQLSGQKSILPYKEETVVAYELGFKWQAPARNFGANGAVFYYNYSDAQGFIVFVDPILGDISRLSNIGDAHHAGVELDGYWEPLDGLRLSGSIGYLDAKIKNGATGQGSLLTSFSYTGLRRDYAPKWSWNAGIDYSFRANNAGLINFGVNADGRSTLVEAQGPDPIDNTFNRIAGYALVNAQLGYKADSGWGISAYARNLLNKSYRLSQGSDGLNSNAEVFGEPLSYGLTATVTF
jgi:iron complex outermembrane recepter protein